MGVMNDCGILDAENNLVEGFWIRYVQDVKNKLKGENLAIFENVNCSPIPPPPPNPAAALIPLEDEEQFPDFRKIWYPRYEEMARGLNTAGGFNPAIPIADPTAIATAMGVTPPQTDLAGAIAGALAVSLIQPPKDPTKLVPIIFPEKSPDELVAETPSLAAKIAEALALPPVPPIPPIPDPKLLEFGYTEQFTYDTELAASPLKTYTAMFEKAADLPGIIAQLPSGPGALLSFVCSASEESQPKRMSTSNVEEAAAQVLKQHQVRLQGAQFLASNIGSGAVTTAVVQGPLELMPAEQLPPPEEEIPLGYMNPPPKVQWEEALSTIRQRILLKIDQEIFDEGTPENPFTACEYDIYVEKVKDPNIPEENNLVPDPKTGKIKVKTGTHSAGKGWLFANDNIARWNSPGTSCGLLPKAVFKKLGATPGVLNFNVYGNTWVQDKNGVAAHSELTNYVIGPLSAGPTAYKQLGLKTKTWVFAWNPDDSPTGQFPRPGDIFVLTKSVDEPFNPDPDLMEDNERYANSVQHVGVCKKFTMNSDGKGGKMFTADFGQSIGQKGAQGGRYLDREWKFDEKGRIKIIKPIFNGEERFVYGWIDVDRFPFDKFK